MRRAVAGFLRESLLTTVRRLLEVGLSRVDPRLTPG